MSRRQRACFNVHFNALGHGYILCSLLFLQDAARGMRLSAGALQDCPAAAKVRSNAVPRRHIYRRACSCLCSTETLKLLIGVIALAGPWKVVESVARCLKPDGRFCSFSPCIEQARAKPRTASLCIAILKAQLLVRLPARLSWRVGSLPCCVAQGR